MKFEFTKKELEMICGCYGLEMWGLDEEDVVIMEKLREYIKMVEKDESDG